MKTKNNSLSEVLAISIRFRSERRNASIRVSGKNIKCHIYNAAFVCDGEQRYDIKLHDKRVYELPFNLIFDGMDKCKILIENPHDLTMLVLNDPALDVKIENLHLCFALRYFSVKNTNCTMYLEDFALCQSLRRIELDNTSSNGDVSILSKLSGLMWVTLDNTECAGDISVLSRLTKLWRFSASNSKVYGDINTIHCPDIGALRIDGTKCVGDPKKFISDNNNLEEFKGLDYNFRRSI